ncbi:MAG: 30S ribosomal protein S18 [Candidatus Paraimprobicoccus trichonymphae]|uniref:Small ribosomal subunit protein bS18 n=1 Tax=Candidatus Paraimprobicoccus trichonymphae TaxID=3033793 RepID=A0AA48IBV3_9FIRM|nr:MAG: 30S ribosomal protein S18 [Candidatus Paraimprobicoccus trichonymphae]
MSEEQQKESRYTRRAKKVCPLCTNKTFENINYKEPYKLRKFISERAKILPRRATGCCALHQRKIMHEIKRARYLALLPYKNG